MQQIIRRGDYYEVQIVDREIIAETKKKPEQPNPNICTEVISTGEAIQKFSLPPKLNMEDNRLRVLKEQLRNIEKALQRDPKADPEDVKTTKALLVDLAELEIYEGAKVNIKQFKKAVSPAASQIKPVEYKLTLPVSNSLENRIKRLEDIEYPKILKLEQLVSILVGEQVVSEEKMNRSKTAPKSDNINNLFNRYQKLESTIEQFPHLVERIERSEGVHCQIAETVSKFQGVTTLHHDITEQVASSLKLNQQLAANFLNNKQKLQNTIKSLKERAAKLKKK